MAKTFKGTDGSDEFLGTSGDDICYGGNGNDFFGASAGNDTFNGGAGIDTVIYTDWTSGVEVHLGNGYGTIGSNKKDHYVGIENVCGSSFNDQLTGDNYANVLAGMGGHDKLYGLGGDDSLVADADDILVHGGSGVDTLYIDTTSSMTVTLNNDGTGTAVSDHGTVQLQNIENVTVTTTGVAPRDVAITGNNLDNVLRGFTGNDTLDGGDGSDILYGGGGLGGDTPDSFGSDTFVFYHSGQSHHHQHDMVVDFQPGIDRIDLSHTPVQNWDDLWSSGDRYWEDTDQGVLIHTSDSGDTSILLARLHISDLVAHQSDFLF